MVPEFLWVFAVFVVVGRVPQPPARLSYPCVPILGSVFLWRCLCWRKAPCRVFARSVPKPKTNHGFCTTFGGRWPGVGLHDAGHVSLAQGGGCLRRTRLARSQHEQPLDKPGPTVDIYSSAIPDWQSGHGEADRVAALLGTMMLHEDMLGHPEFASNPGSKVEQQIKTQHEETKV